MATQTVIHEIPRKLPQNIPAALPEVLPPFTVEVEQDCEDCGGRGYDLGERFEFTPCPECGGTKKQTVIRQYLAEAFRIAAGQTSMIPERAHLVALTAYARQTVNALMAGKEAA